MGVRTGAIAALALALVPGVAAGDTAPPDPVDPDYPINFLDGVPLDDPIGLTLVSGGDVIRFGTSGAESESVAGLPADIDWTRRAGSRVLVDDWPCEECSTYLVDPAHPESAAVRLPFGSVVGGVDRLWARVVDGESCVVLELDPETGETSDEHPIACDWHPQDEVEAGLVVWDESTDSRRVIDPDALAPLHDLPGWFLVDTVAGPLSLDGRDAVLLDPDTFDAVERFAAPTPTSTPIVRAVSPDGTVAAISYDSPAWPGPRQRLDVWLIDVVSGTWTRVPGMPLAVALKSIGVAFADDGRLVIAGHLEGTGPAVVVWDGVSSAVGVRPVDIVGIGDVAVFASVVLSSSQGR